VSLPTTNLTWICPVSNSDLRGEGANNHMGQWSPEGKASEAPVPGPVLWHSPLVGLRDMTILFGPSVQMSRR